MARINLHHYMGIAKKQARKTASREEVRLKGRKKQVSSVSGRKKQAKKAAPEEECSAERQEKSSFIRIREEKVS